MYVSEYYSRHDTTTMSKCSSDEVEPLSACRDGVPGFLWGRVGGLGHVVGPVAAVGVLPDELDGDGALDVVGHVEQLAAHDPDIVLLEAGLGLGGGCRSPLDGDWLLLLLGRWWRLLSVTLWGSLLLRWRRELLILGLLAVLHRWLLLLLLCRRVPDPAKVVHDTSLGCLVAPGDCAGRVGARAGRVVLAGALRLLERCVVSAAEVSHVCFLMTTLCD